MRPLFAILISFFISLEVRGAGDCLSRKLSELLEDASKDELVASLLEDIQKAKELSPPISKLDAELEIAEEAGDVKKIKFLEAELEKARQPILAMNNDFMKKTAALFEKQGIPNVMYESEGQLIMKLTLENAPKNNRALKFYERAKRLFGVEKVTISFGENAAYLRKGFFKPGESRVEIGHNEILSLIDGDIGVTPRHEFRHGIFAFKAKKDIPSLYHMRFKSPKNGKRLNSLGMYDKYMSAEEVYNWSTDLHTLSRKLRDATPDKEAKILKDIAGKVNGSIAVNGTASEMSKSLIARLQETIDQKVYVRLEIPEGKTLKFEDTFGRTGEISFYGPEREQILEAAREINENLSKRSGEFVENALQKQGFKERTGTDYTLARKKLLKDYLYSEEGKEFVEKLQEAKRVIAQDAIDRLKSMQRISDIQIEEAKALKEVMEKLPDADPALRPTIILDMRTRMRRIADNVKEVFKDSVLNKSGP